ncbi:unnamed protein product, partial [Brenthis ino]
MGNRHSSDVIHTRQDQESNSVGILQAGIKGIKPKHKICDPSIKKPKTMRKPRLLNKTKSTRIDFNAIKELYSDKMPVMLAFITTESECRLRLSKKPTKYSSMLVHNADEKSCRRVFSLPCSKYCRDCRKLSSECVY